MGTELIHPARPTLTTSAAFGALILTLTAGCSARDDASAPALPPLRAAVTADPDAPGVGFDDTDALTRALLTAENLPVGFITVPDLVRDLGLTPLDPDPTTESHPATEPAQCANVLSELALQRPGAASSSAARFTGPDYTSIDQDAASYRDSAIAAAAFADVQKTLASCTSYQGTDAEGIRVDYALGGREHPLPGMDAAALGFQVVTTSEGFSLYSDAVIAAVGPTLIQLVATGPEPIDPAVFNELVAAAIDKISAGQHS